MHLPVNHLMLIASLKSFFSPYVECFFQIKTLGILDESLRTTFFRAISNAFYKPKLQEMKEGNASVPVNASS